MVDVLDEELAAWRADERTSVGVSVGWKMRCEDEEDGPDEGGVGIQGLCAGGAVDEVSEGWGC